MVQSVARGFKVHAGGRSVTAAGLIDISHGRSFVLLDRDRRIRGYYSPDAEHLRALERDLRQLVAH
jgi:hypothetical protein